MKKLKTILIIIGILVAGCAFQATAQKNKAERTSSHKAYYGSPPGNSQFKTKNTVKKKKNKAGYTTSKKAKGKREGKHGRRPRAIL